MEVRWFLITLMTLGQLVLQSSPLTQRQKETSYAETRKLLLKMERNADNKALKKLFEKGEEIARPVTLGVRRYLTALCYSQVMPYENYA